MQHDSAWSIDMTFWILEGMWWQQWHGSADCRWVNMLRAFQHDWERSVSKQEQIWVDFILGGCVANTKQIRDIWLAAVHQTQCKVY